MQSSVEFARRTLEDIEDLEQQSVEYMLLKPKTHRDQILQQSRVAHNIEAIKQNSIQTQELFNDPIYKEELEKITDFSEFYSRLKDIKDYYRPRHNELYQTFNEKPGVNADQEMEKLECIFTGEETLGRHLDLNELYLLAMNLKGIDRTSYLVYLDRFERFKYIPEQTKRSVRYKEYLDKMYEYLVNWIKRSQPLFDLEHFLDLAHKEFEQ
jgi:splicing factor 3A subunit 3